MVILMILAGIVVPAIGGLGDGTEATVMATTVRQVRERIEYQSAVSVNGRPGTVDPRWFDNGRLPQHAWTRRPLKIQVVNGPKTATFPNNKTCVIKPDGTAAGHTAWYNAANGSFCVLVPKTGDAQEDLQLFAAVNGFELEPVDAGNGSGNNNPPQDDDDEDDDDDDD